MRIKRWVCLSCLAVRELKPSALVTSTVVCLECYQAMQPLLARALPEVASAVGGMPGEDATTASGQVRQDADTKERFPGYSPSTREGFIQEKLVCLDCGLAFDLWVSALRVWGASCPYCMRPNGVVGRC